MDICMYQKQFKQQLNGSSLVSTSSFSLVSTSMDITTKTKFILKTQKLCCQNG